MDNNTMFEQASRLKLRFDTLRGQLSVEDLWDLPLTSPTGRSVNLDAIAIGLHKQVRDTAETVSFVAPAAEDFGKYEVGLKFELVKYVIAVKVGEQNAAKTAADHREKKQRLLGLIAQKEDQALGERSVEELRELVASL